MKASVFQNSLRKCKVSQIVVRSAVLCCSQTNGAIRLRHQNPRHKGPRPRQIHYLLTAQLDSSCMSFHGFLSLHGSPPSAIISWACRVLSHCFTLTVLGKGWPKQRFLDNPLPTMFEILGPDGMPEVSATPRKWGNLRREPSRQPAASMLRRSSNRQRCSCDICRSLSEPWGGHLRDWWSFSHGVMDHYT